MIRYQDAIAVARSLIGTPYAELDCINLIKKIIRVAPGGVRSYTTAGTNSLWKSYAMSKKYKDLTWRQTGLNGARAGMLAFKSKGDNVHHVGIVTERGTVVHASSALGRTVETPLGRAEGWTLLAIHRYIAPAQDAESTQDTAKDTDESAQDDAKGNAKGTEDTEQRTGSVRITIVDSEENRFVPAGDFRVLVGSED